ncbi:3'-5' exonuclease [Sphingomonas sp. HMP6]|uniref:3'-5' exonuclease n=1 Tax=Sphingomonas sp. HMP6 TaxID=1517551 RepID=UPI0015964B81|nr:3'-5' exonuclease [Sphingomonas sp. HMP6]BCA58155.1 hypothetical protein HMP06_0924 [Sphingomonas sp. HMP6]
MNDNEKSVGPRARGIVAQPDRVRAVRHDSEGHPLRRDSGDASAPDAGAAGLSRFAEALEGHPEYRVLRRLELKEGHTGLGTSDAPFIGVSIDVETTGIDHARDRIIELALRRFRYDRDGVIVAIDRSYAWLEDPGRPIPLEIARLTGLTDSVLENQSIDDDAAVRLLRSATVIVAHNAAFDRKFVERRLPDAAGLAWACSCNEIDWRGSGFDGRALGWLLGQAGWFHDGHRAGEDVDGVIALLGHRLADGRTALAALVERADANSWVLRARGAAFEVKDLLRLRGYRWDAERKLWWREVSDADRMQEEFWLAGHVYSAEANPKALGPDFVRMTRFERHR